MEITEEKLLKLKVRLKKICDFCYEQQNSLLEIIEKSDEIASEVQIIWSSLTKVNRQESPAHALTNQTQPSQKPALGQDREKEAT